MKRQINYILMQTVLWGGWICEYIWFLKYQFQMRFDLWVFVAYLFLLYLCVVRKLGNNNNRRYEIYMELWGISMVSDRIRRIDAIFANMSCLRRFGILPKRMG